MGGILMEKLNIWLEQNGRDLNPAVYLAAPVNVGTYRNHTVGFPEPFRRGVYGVRPDPQDGAKAM